MTDALVESGMTDALVESGMTGDVYRRCWNPCPKVRLINWPKRQPE
jgi:hypothetical protein